jgi:hypothetical protein
MGLYNRFGDSLTMEDYRLLLFSYAGRTWVMCHCEESMVGQASSLSITDDGQDARPTGNLGFGCVPRYAALRSARNDNILCPVTDGSL